MNIRLQTWKAQGHPIAAFEGEEEDVCYLLQDWCARNDHPVLDNGGEFDPDVEDGLVYLLYDDEGNDLAIELFGELRDDNVLEITAIKVVEKLTEEEAEAVSKKPFYETKPISIMVKYTLLEEMRAEITRINAAAGMTIFNPALTTELDALLKYE